MSPETKGDVQDIYQEQLIGLGHDTAQFFNLISRFNLVVHKDECLR